MNSQVSGRDNTGTVEGKHPLNYGDKPCPFGSDSSVTLKTKHDISKGLAAYEWITSKN